MPPPGRVWKGLVNSALLKPIFAGHSRSYKRARAQINLQEAPPKAKPGIREEEAKAWPDLDLGAFYSEVAMPVALCRAARIDTEAPTCRWPPCESASMLTRSSKRCRLLFLLWTGLPSLLTPRGR